MSLKNNKNLDEQNIDKKQSINVWKGTGFKNAEFDEKRLKINFKNEPKKIVNQLTAIKESYSRLQDKIEMLKEQAERVPELEAKVEELQNTLVRLLTVRVDNLEEFLKHMVVDDHKLSDEAKKLYDRINAKYNVD